MYSVSLSKTNSVVGRRQIRRATHLGKVSFLQIVGLVIPLGWLSDSTWQGAEEGALAGWTSQ